MGFFENLHRELEKAVVDMEKQERERNKERYERKQAKARLKGQKREKATDVKKRFILKIFLKVKKTIDFK